MTPPPRPRRLPAGVVPETPGPGQESVWDYPRPPALVPLSADIRITLGGIEVLRADSALLIKETSHPPTFYLPADAWRAGCLRRASGSSMCEWKGAARYFDVVAADDGGAIRAVAERAAWDYPSPWAPYEALAGHVSVYPAAMDSVTVDGEAVRGQDGGFYGGWITANVVGPFKGVPGSTFW